MTVACRLTVACPFVMLSINFAWATFVQLNQPEGIICKLTSASQNGEGKKNMISIRIGSATNSTPPTRHTVFCWSIIP